MDENEVRIIVREMIPEILEAVKYPISEHALLKLPEVMGHMIKQNQARALFIEKFLKEHPEFLLNKELVMQTIKEYQSKYPFRSLDEMLEGLTADIKKRDSILNKMDTITKDKPSTEFIGAL